MKISLNIYNYSRTDLWTHYMSTHPWERLGIIREIRLTDRTRYANSNQDFLSQQLADDAANLYHVLSEKVHSRHSRNTAVELYAKEFDHVQLAIITKICSLIPVNYILV